MVLEDIQYGFKGKPIHRRNESFHGAYAHPAFNFSVVTVVMSLELLAKNFMDF
tara:strand:+ start:353 stop:511 length:159 start_codon:yes stop_codon:yes gene_type:complete